MKREYVAGALILTIMAVTLYNTSYVERKTKILTENIETAEKIYLNGDRNKASECVEDSMDNWLSWDSYAHIMLRHSEVDLVTDAYFELLTKLQSDDSVPKASFDKLTEQLHSISRMEKVSFGSVF